MGLFLSIAAAGCDPEAPGASGTMSLGSGVDATTFQTLEIRTFADTSDLYDQSQPIPSDADRDTKPVAGITFPHRYLVGGGIGSSNVGTWRLVAWLSHRALADADQATNFDPGDAFCSVPYRVQGCGVGLDGYCGVTGAVDCILAPWPPGP
jgi:hypothetical protein